MAPNRMIWILTGVFALACTAVQAQVSDARIRELIRQAAEKVSQTDASVQPPVAGAAAQARPVVRLTLDEAVKLTLDRNLDIAVQRLNPEINDIAIVSVRSVYHPTLTSTIGPQSVTQLPTSQVQLGTGGVATVSDSSLVSPPLVAGDGPVTVTFVHQFDFDRDGVYRDGGVVE